MLEALLKALKALSTFLIHFVLIKTIPPFPIASKVIAVKTTAAVDDDNDDDDGDEDDDDVLKSTDLDVMTKYFLSRRARI